MPRVAPRDRPRGAISPRPERTPAPASAAVARPKPAVQPKPAAQSAAQSAQPGRYVVQAGDTLYSIAWRHRMDHRALGKANGVPAPYLIYPGQQLTVQPGARAARPPAKPTRGGKLRWRWPVRSGINAKAASPPPGSLGIKLTLPVGTPVRASVGGTVVYAGNGLPGYGNLLIIKHDADWLSAYGRNQRLLAQEGQTVAGGDPVALSGRDADGKPGLYFEIRRRGEQMDARRLLPKRWRQAAWRSAAGLAGGRAWESSRTASMARRRAKPAQQLNRRRSAPSSGCSGRVGATMPLRGMPWPRCHGRHESSLRVPGP